MSTWDIFHISGGALVSIWRSEINLGITYGFGSAKVLGPINLPEGETQGNLADLLQNSDIEYSRIKLLIGFSFALN